MIHFNYFQTNNEIIKLSINNNRPVLLLVIEYVMYKLLYKNLI